DFSEKRRATPKPLLYIAMPWFLVRLLVAFVLEVVAKLLLLILGATLWLLARLLRPATVGVGQFLLSPVVRLSGAFFERLGRAYPRAIHWSLDHSTPILLCVLACGWITWEAGRRLGTELLPEVHQGEFTFEVGLPVGTPLERTIAALEEVEKTILASRQD